MKLQWDKARPFGAAWIVANVIGFFIGSLLGATDGGLVSQVMGSGAIAKVMGDLVFGFCFGTAQWFILYRFYPESRPRLWWWIVASMVGFSIGARLGALIAPLAGSSQLAIGLVFGIVMGTSLGIVQWGAIRILGALKTERAAGWMVASILAWILGESIAFQLRFSQAGVPLVALAIALVTGIALLWWIRPR